MKTTSTSFFELLHLEYKGAGLSIKVAELVDGEPDSYIGTPLVINNKSQVFSLFFAAVTEFRTRAEPCFSVPISRADLAPYLLECTDSEYINQVCPFGAGAKEPARHFVVFTESVIIEVLSSNAPDIQLILNYSSNDA